MTSLALPAFVKGIQSTLASESILKLENTDRKSCVALIMRPLPSLKGEVKTVNDLELFFMLRALNEGDRWGGQVSFPGGKQEEGETDEETCAREVFEEIGFRLPHLNRAFGGENEEFILLGSINDRRIVMQEQSMATIQKTPPVSLSEGEVDACGWCEFSKLMSKHAASPLRFNISHIIQNETAAIKYVVNKLDLDAVYFTKVKLEIMDLAAPKSLNFDDEKVIRGRFFLWGLTLGFVNDFLFNVTKMRTKPILLSKPCFGKDVEVVYGSGLHNVLLSIYRSSYLALTGTQMAWNEYTVWYPKAVIKFCACCAAGVASRAFL